MDVDIYPQAHEGITGTALDDDLLSLEDTAFSRRMMMIGLAECLGDAVRFGRTHPAVAKMDNWIKNPEPGDLVIAIGMSGARLDKATRTMAFGILIARRVEWATTDAQLAAHISELRAAGDVDDAALLESGHGRATDEAWYVQYGPAPNNVCRWTDQHFMAVPTKLGMFLWPDQIPRRPDRSPTATLS